LQIKFDLNLKNGSGETCSRAVFALILIMALLYAVILSMDFSARSGSDILKYIEVILAFVISVICGIKERKFFSGAALGLTLYCDYFLLFEGKNAFAIAVFSFAHIFYFVRLLQKKKKVFWFIVVLIILWMLPGDFFIRACVGYAFCLGVHFFCAVRVVLKKPSLRNKLVFWGAFLFVLCDISVAWYNVYGGNLAGDLMWLFYTPAIALLAVTPSADTDEVNGFGKA